MTRKHRKRFVLLLLVLITFLAAGQTVQACVCPDGDDSTLGRFESARFVVVNKVVSVNKQPGTITTIVEKVYKGDLKAGDEMIFRQGENADCLVTFQDEDVGAKFLFYLKPSEKKPKLWSADSCGQSKPLPNYQTNHIENAAADLLYLDKMNEVHGKTRISGTVISYQWTIADGGADFKPVAGRKVHIVANGKSYETVTNEHGVYEIYDLPVGTYAIRPEGKQGWEIDVNSAFGALTSGRNEDDGSAEVQLKASRHAYSDFVFKVDNRLSGKVLDGSGRPLAQVCLRLLPTQPNVSKYFKRDDCTDPGGRFKFEEIPFANYVIVINDDDRISSRQPFRRFYYPDVSAREKAQIIAIVEGVTEYPFDIHVPAVKDVFTVTGKVLSADDKPVVFARVVFTSDRTDPAIDGSAFAMTDESGNFSLNVLKGSPGELLAYVTLDPKEFEKCPTHLRVRGEISLDRRTGSVRVEANRALEGVDLRFPFPSCNREKIRSQIKID
jgi:hypothetical protein